MFERCPSVPLREELFPANNGIEPYLQVPAYMMYPGAGAYIMGRRIWPDMVHVEQNTYKTTDVPFQKMSIDYKS